MKYIKYLSILICILLLFGITPTKHVNASLSNANNIAIYQDSTTNLFYVVAMNQNFYVENNRFYYQSVYSYSNSSRYFTTYDAALSYINNVSFYLDTSGSKTLGSIKLLVLIKGNINVPSGFNFGDYYFPSDDAYQDYLNPPVEKTWWDKLYDWFEEQYSEIADIWPDDPIWQWIWGGDGENINNTDIVMPTLVPTPTQIPYQTVIVPVRDPVTGDIISYNYEYHYNNPSGTPIAATAPPDQPERQPTGAGSSDNYNPQDPLAIPSGINWINPGFKAGDYQDEFSNPLGALSDGLDMISYSFSSASGEYTQGVSGISQSFQFIPSSWFMLIGMGAAIIILAGIINRFLG